MISAENDALPGGKVGGIGDVIRDLPPALAEQGQWVSVITPGYQLLSRGPGASQQASLTVPFCGKEEQVNLYRVEAKRPHDGVVNWVLEHELFAAGGPGTIYCTRDREPFATDAHKFVLFCSAVAEALAQGKLGQVDVLHCHDWHAAPLLFIREFLPRYRFLRQMQGVYSIHNLSIQGVRPLSGHRSSTETWFPNIEFDANRMVDPHHEGCINWMRTGINLADRVHAVSPNYSREILRPTDMTRHFIGGEGLEEDLQKAHEEGHLVGILNGCDYSQASDKPVGKGRLCQIIESSLSRWVDERLTIPSAHFHALQRLDVWRGKRKLEPFTVTSIGRLTDQKNRLLTEQLDERTVLEHILEELREGFFIMLGSGDAEYEAFFTRVMVRHENFLFLQGYSDELASALYSYGDLFLMPSSFEPCGLSQMLAMRSGTPCLVHAVGGLADTVQHGVDGFVFNGDNLQQQAENLLSTFGDAVRLKQDKAPKWREMCRAAFAARFTWEDTAKSLLEQVYEPGEPEMADEFRRRASWS